MKKDAVIIGYSGHAYVVYDTLIANDYNVYGYCEKDEKVYNPFSLKYIGVEDDITIQKHLTDYDIFIGIGDNLIRKQILANLLTKNLHCPGIKHPNAVVSPTVSLNQGTVIMAGAIVNTLSQIGVGVICNTASVIEHECKIANFVHIAPGAVLAGAVSVGENSFIGANAVIKQGVSIGANSIVGAGAVVVKNVKEGAIVYGNPAKCK